MRLILFVALLLVSTPLLSRADDWPQWMGPHRDNVWREEGLLEKFPAGGPRSRVAYADGWRLRRPRGGRGQGFRHRLRDRRKRESR